MERPADNVMPFCILTVDSRPKSQTAFCCDTKNKIKLSQKRYQPSTCECPTIIRKLGEEVRSSKTIRTANYTLQKHSWGQQVGKVQNRRYHEELRLQRNFGQGGQTWKQKGFCKWKIKWQSESTDLSANKRRRNKDQNSITLFFFFLEACGMKPNRSDPSHSG